ncbi:TetR family transcriptional regulator [Ancylobacter aquaticus]|uniref:TetR family transcriptional regulator n=1 Tax=Ancylobacter aquaticus TaxID=100 RepID=A0A4R1HL92_ANCAQ|nr:TetR/AcrR family transcriptional regulator [Ancylobacter aquaticus]TCK23177.1 TetR family transcriptional regulator [Ancylobacter aquaticus]
MDQSKPRPDRPKSTTRERILDAAERLLGQGGAGFSMRELAEEAGVSFATPFNQFGSKAGIMLALSERRIDAMRDRLARATLPATAVERVLVATDIATAVMLGSSAVNRAVMAAVGAPNDPPGSVALRSGAWWAEALGAGADLPAGVRSLAIAVLPRQLAIAFRGVLSFWTAGELSDEALGPEARAAAAGVLLGFSGPADRARLLSLLEADQGPTAPPPG